MVIPDALDASWYRAEAASPIHFRQQRPTCLDLKWRRVRDTALAPVARRRESTTNSAQDRHDDRS